MGRSLGDVRSVTIPGQDSLPSPLFQAQGLEYAVERRGDRVFHTEIKREAGGRVVARNEAEARYVIGSGEQAMAFLLERGDGYLFESPITWYSGKRKWDLSPGYEKDNVHFERLVKPACLFCHSNQFDHVEGTENRYRQPIFQGHAIGCERCHGPGELHVRKPEQVGDEPPEHREPGEPEARASRGGLPAMPPAGGYPRGPGRPEAHRLPPGAALDIHRIGIREGRDRRQDPLLRPGRADAREPLLPREPGQDGLHLVPRPSRVARPEPEGRVLSRAVPRLAIRKRGAVCRGPERLAGGRDDRCIDCHMPRSPNEQVPHTATTLHLIPRFKDRPGAEDGTRTSLANGGLPLVPFHRDQVEESERSAVSRDLGIALVTMNRALPGLTPAAVGRMALPLLEASLAANPADGPAWDAKGSALWMLARREESLAAFRTALGLAPDNEQTLVGAGTRAAQMRKPAEALVHLERAIAINPWRADYHQAVALVHSQGGEWAAAIEAARDSLRLNPWDREARMLLIQCLLGDRRPREAQGRVPGPARPGPAGSGRAPVLVPQNRLWRSQTMIRAPIAEQ